jgi:hypothetical protein
MEVILQQMKEKQVNDDLFDIILNAMINHNGIDILNITNNIFL